MNRRLVFEHFEKAGIKSAARSCATVVWPEVDRRLYRTRVSRLDSKLATRRVTTELAIRLDDENPMRPFIREGLEPDVTCLEGERFDVECNVGVFDVVIVDLE
jgi:hypothetical protein